MKNLINKTIILTIALLSLNSLYSSEIPRFQSDHLKSLSSNEEKLSAIHQKGDSIYAEQLNDKFEAAKNLIVDKFGNIEENSYTNYVFSQGSIVDADIINSKFQSFIDSLLEEDSSIVIPEILSITENLQNNNAINAETINLKFLALNNLISESVASWPFGSMGDLHILSGQTVTVNAGETLDYNNLTIDSGGTLKISGTTGDITFIGVKGSFVLNGSIVARSLHNGGTFSATSPNGEAISYSVLQVAGGNGGTGNWNGNYGVQANGWGGGGAGGSNGNVGGGSGGTNNGNGGGSSGASGGLGNLTQGPGGDGGSNGNRTGGSGGGSGGGAGANDTAYWPVTGGGGGGGGGGSKGLHGLGLFLYLKGDISGLGTIDLSGSNGFNGGMGGSYFLNLGGGGGGGGAGGSGGKLMVRKKNNYTFTPNILINEGIGGNGGALPAGLGNTVGATAGGNGQSGQVGSIDIQDF